MTLLSLTGVDAAADRACLQSLVDFQKATPADALKGPALESVRGGLQAFQAHAMAAVAQPFGERQLAAFERSFSQLLEAVQGQPVLALHPALSGPGAGPVSQDIALLLRRAALDEGVALDLAIRWWQLARGAGLPVDADFGECYRLMEWTGLLQQLSQQAGHVQDWTGAVRVALRYAPIKPLVLLLEPLSGASARAGYTF